MADMAGLWLSHHIGNGKSSQLTHIFQRGWRKTTNQWTFDGFFHLLGGHGVHLQIRCLIIGHGPKPMKLPGKSPPIHRYLGSQDTHTHIIRESSYVHFNCKWNEGYQNPGYVYVPENHHIPSPYGKLIINGRYVTLQLNQTWPGGKFHTNGGCVRWENHRLLLLDDFLQQARESKITRGYIPLFSHQYSMNSSWNDASIPMVSPMLSHFSDTSSFLGQPAMGSETNPEISAFFLASWKREKTMGGSLLGFPSWDTHGRLRIIPTPFVSSWNSLPVESCWRSQGPEHGVCKVTLVRIVCQHTCFAYTVYL